MSMQRWLEKSIFNPAFRAAIRLGRAPKDFALPETAGRALAPLWIRNQTDIGL